MVIFKEMICFLLDFYFNENKNRILRYQIVNSG